MAYLQPEQIKSILEAPQGTQAIAACNKHHARLRLHTVPTLAADEAGAAYSDFMRWVKSYLPADKYERFEQLVGFPLPTVQLTKKAFKELKRIFEGENKHTRVYFTREELEQDFETYDQETLQLETFLQGAYWRAVKTSINSFLVVDMPAVKLTAQPEPYVYIVNTAHVYSVAKTGKKVEHIAYHPDGNKKRLILLDDAYYRVYTLDEKTSKWVEESANKHVLEYCPARSLWNEELDVEKDYIQQQGPITGVLELLDKYLFWYYAHMYFETYGSFPITWEYATDCNYVDEMQNPCKDGWVTSYIEGATPQSEPTVKRSECPKCTGKSLTGPGTVKIVGQPQYKDDHDPRDPAGFIPVDVDALTYGNNRMSERENFVLDSIVGRGAEAINDQAVNEKQVRSLFESKQDVLMDMKRNIETVQHWILGTIAILRYGKEAVSKVTVNRGDEFYVRGEDEVAAEYDLLKKSGMPQFIVSAARELYTKTKYRSNEDLRQRMEILAHLEPYPELTHTEVTTLFTSGYIKQELALLKAGFDYYLKRFEREQLPVEQFGMLLEFDARINAIKTILLTYVGEDATKPEPVEPSGLGGNTGATANRFGK